MRKIYLFLLCMFVTSCLEAQTDSDYLNYKFQSINDRSTVTISEKLIYFEDDYGGEYEGVKKIEEAILRKNTDKMTIYTTESANYVVLFTQFDSVKYLTLLQESSSNKKFFNTFTIYGYYTNNRKISNPYLYGVSILNAKDYVQETIKGENVSYLPKRWEFFDAPWAVNTASKNKVIVFSCSLPSLYRSEDEIKMIKPIDKLIISNGFTLPRQIDLFEKNARAKTIKISYGSYKENFVLEDTAEFQVLDLTKPILPINNTEITLEILDTYEGELYDDIVISSVYFPIIKK